MNWLKHFIVLLTNHFTFIGKVQTELKLQICNQFKKPHQIAIYQKFALKLNPNIYNIFPITPRKLPIYFRGACMCQLEIV